MKFSENLLRMRSKLRGLPGFAFLPLDPQPLPPLLSVWGLCCQGERWCPCFQPPCLQAELCTNSSSMDGNVGGRVSRSRYAALTSNTTQEGQLLTFRAGAEAMGENVQYRQSWKPKEEPTKTETQAASSGQSQVSPPCTDGQEDFLLVGRTV